MIMEKQRSLENSVLRELYFGGSLSCSELSDRLNRSIPSVTKAVNKLVQETIVKNGGKGKAKGGRPPSRYSLLPDTKYILSVAADQLSTRITMTDLLCTPVSEPAKFDLTLLNNADAARELAVHINKFIERSGQDKENIIGVGIGMPGFVNPTEGVNYTYLPTEDMTLRDYLIEKIGLPVWIDNDSSLVALAELRFGVAQHGDSTMVLNIGWGIGLGIILKGELFHGHNGYAGEFSHIPVREGGELCVCGKHGCLETEASMYVIAKKAINEIKKGRVSFLQKVKADNPAAMGEAILKAANKGDEFAIDLILDMGYKIGKAVSILIHILNPQTIVLSGRGAAMGRTLVTAIQNSLSKYCIPRLAENTEFRLSKMGHDAELVGAAALVMENYEELIR